MNFDSPVYFLFLTLVVILYWRMQWRRQNQFLLAASYLFYACWDWRFLFLIAGSTLLDYWLARVIDESIDTSKKRTALIFSLVCNFGLLGVFKYCGFFIDSLVYLTQWLSPFTLSRPALEIILPAGISFYTFQAVAYITDVYYGKMAASRSLLNYALFISFFPHLVAGPIQRPSHLLPQTEGPRVYDPRTFFDGLMLIVSGLFRKCVIADNCALLANAAFDGSWGEPTLASVAIGVYAFAWQIYADFSAYSDIARGSAQLLGFHFMVNFRQPYLATSLSDFWRRWHISLSTWLRDYLYIPLGGNRLGELRTLMNLFVTMLLGGLWHGANWTFVIWGALHGTGLALERIFGLKPSTSGLPERIHNTDSGTHRWSIWIRRLVVFHLICVGWIFFRASSWTDAVHFMSGVTHWGWRSEYGAAFAFLGLAVLPLFLIDLRLEAANEEYPCEKLSVRVGFRNSYAWRVLLASFLLIAVLVFGAVQPSAFIYFQF